MKEMIIDSTELRQLIDQEINYVSTDKLSELYQFIQYFRLGSQVISNGTMVNSNSHYTELYDDKKINAVSNNGSDTTNEHGMTSREITLSLAGSWSDMPDEEFDDFLNEVYARRRGEHLVVDA